MIHLLVNQWYLDCISELNRCFGMVEFDDIAYTWILIEEFPLPGTFYQVSSTLLIGVPGLNIENYAGYDFFMDLELSRLDSTQRKHLIDTEWYNPHKHLGYCRLSYHLQAFNPTYPIGNGDTLLDICQSLFHFLGQKWE